MRLVLITQAFAVTCLLSACTSSTLAGVDAERFDVLYTVSMKPDTHSAVVKIRLARNSALVKKMDFAIDTQRYSEFIGSGAVSVEGNRVVWEPPAEDAWFQYHVGLTSKRDNGKYDGRVTAGWALFRADDLVPPFHSVFKENSSANAKLAFNLPEDWTVQTRYPRDKSGRYKVDDPERKFDRPTGWLVMGKLGARRDRIGDTKVAVAAPRGQNVRYLDILAFLRWTLPHLKAVFPQFSDRLLIVSAADPMWRGALSAPNSLYVHSDRPLISGNATSTFLHELVHIAMQARSGPGADWIVEGLAEYYSLEILHRSGAISADRYADAHRELAKWGEEGGELDTGRSQGATTAKAVSVLRDLDGQIRKNSGGAQSLDDVARALAAESVPVTGERFNALTEKYQD